MNQKHRGQIISSNQKGVGHHEVNKDMKDLLYTKEQL